MGLERGGVKHGRRISWAGVSLTAAYLVLAALAVSYPFCKQAVDPGNAELAGVPPLVLGLLYFLAWKAAALRTRG